MKPKNFIVIALVVAILCLGLWWFTRSKASAPEKTAVAKLPAPSQVEAPKYVAPSTIAPPLAPPAAKPDAAPIAAAHPTADSSPDPNADPQADLKTAIPDIARIKRAGDMLAFAQTYTPPDELDPQDIQIIQKFQAEFAKDPGLKERTQPSAEAEAQAWEALEEQTPTLNSTGDEATYTFTSPPEPDAGQPVSIETTIVFLIINGKWYVKIKK